MDLNKEYKLKGNKIKFYDSIYNDDNNDERLSLIFEKDNRGMINYKEQYKGGDKYTLIGYDLIYGNGSSIDTKNASYHYENIKLFDIRNGKLIYECYREDEGIDVPYDDIVKNENNKYHWHISTGKNGAVPHPKLFDLKNIKNIIIRKSSEPKRLKLELHREFFGNNTIEKYKKIETIDMEEKENFIKSLSDQDLHNIAKQSGTDKPKRTEILTKSYDRDIAIREDAIRLSKGICRLCLKKAPFNKKDGSPYLESHHVIPLVKGGADKIYNCVALCPNCHRKMHIVEDVNDIEKLKKIAMEQSD